MSKYLKCPNCGSEVFKEVALEWTEQEGVKIRKDEGPLYDEAQEVEPEGGPSVEAYYKCSECDGEFYLVDGKLTEEEPKAETTDLVGELLQACRCALADLEGIMPEFEPCGDRKHPGWQTMEQLEAVIAKAEKDGRVKVIVEVSNGVADVTSCPVGVEVEIIDHDNKWR